MPCFRYKMVFLKSGAKILINISTYPPSSMACANIDNRFTVFHYTVNGGLHKAFFLEEFAM